MISGPIPIPGMRVTFWTFPSKGLWTSALAQLAFNPYLKRGRVFVNLNIETNLLIINAYKNPFSHKCD